MVNCWAISITEKERRELQLAHILIQCCQFLFITISTILREVEAVGNFMESIPALVCSM